MRLRPAIAFVCACVVTLGTVGAAAASVPGGFVQLPGAAGCVANAGAGGCTAAHDLVAARIVTSPDGRNVYVTTFGGNSVLVFDRDPTTGALTQKPGEAGCVHTGAETASCASAPLMVSPFGLAFAPDGRTVYVSNLQGPSRVITFTRDPATGALTVKPGGAGCISGVAGDGPCRPATGIHDPFALAVSPDGRNLYVSSGLVSVAADDAVTALAIDANGELSQVGDAADGAGCVADTAVTGCTDGRALADPGNLGFGPDGGTLYVARPGGPGGVTALKRSPASGRLSVIPGAAGCVVSAAQESCDVLPELSGVNDIAVDAGTVYAGGILGQVVALDRLADGGIRRHPGEEGCVSGTPFSGCSTARAITQVASLALSRDGADLYAASIGGDGGLVELDRSAGGGIVARPDVRGCAAFATVASCAPIFGFTDSAGNLALAPDGRNLYLASGPQIGIFKRDTAGPACEASAVTIQAGATVTLPLPCSDADGDPFNVSVVGAPSLGSLGRLDNNAHTIVYTAPAAQSGTTTIALRAAYPDGTFPSSGSIAVTVQDSIDGGGTPGIDNDHDGFFAGQDCNDDNAAIHPGAVEIKGNRVDENCDGIVEPFQTVASGVSTKWNVKRSRLTLTGLLVTQPPAKPFSAEIRCSGKGCPFTRKALNGKVRNKTLNALSSLSSRQRRFRAKETLEVWVSAPGFNTKVAQLRLKAGKIPTTTPLCVPPGASRPQSSCA